MFLPRTRCVYFEGCPASGGRKERKLIAEKIAVINFPPSSSRVCLIWQMAQLINKPSPWMLPSRKKKCYWQTTKIRWKLFSEYAECSGGEKEMKHLWKKLFDHFLVFHKKFILCSLLFVFWAPSRKFFFFVSSSPPQVIIVGIFHELTWVCWDGLNVVIGKRTRFFPHFHLSMITTSITVNVVKSSSFTLLEVVQLCFRKFFSVFVKGKNKSLSYVIFVISLMIRNELWHFYSLFFFFIYVCHCRKGERHTSAFDCASVKKFLRLV